MLAITIPGFKELVLHHALLDYNGTLAVDGLLIDEVAEQLNTLSEHLFIHVITGDAYGTARSELANVNCTLTILSEENQAFEKQAYLHQLNPEETVVIGNGRNDCYALKDAALGIAILSAEGVSGEAILAADIILPSILHALELLHRPHRLMGTLRT